MQPALALPAAPGTGPFHTKGLVYRAILRGVERRFPNGRARLLGELPPQLAQFAAQPFLAASWYDIFPVVPISEAAARIAAQPVEAYLREEATVQAKEDLGGIYKLVLSAVTPELAVRALVKVTSRYYDFGEARVDRAEARRIRTTRTAVPGYVCDWYAITSAPYMREVLRAAGARSPQVEVGVTPYVGVSQGHPVRDLVSDIRW